jgi:hypothetical protein
VRSGNARTVQAKLFRKAKRRSLEKKERLDKVRKVRKDQNSSAKS